MKLEGTAADMIRAFEVQLDRYEHNGRQYRARTGGIQIPSELAPSVEAVLGLDNRPQARAAFSCARRGPRAGRRGFLHSAAGGRALSVSAGRGRHRPDRRHSGTGRRVQAGGPEEAIFLLWEWRSPPLFPFRWTRRKMRRPIPNSADGEVLLDIEVVGAVAPGAKIVVYFAPNTVARFSGCADHGDPRCHQQPVRHFDQLGQRRIHLDRPGHDGFRFGRAGRRRAGRHHLRRLGRQRVERWGDRRRQSCGFPRLQPAYPGVRRAPA